MNKNIKVLIYFSLGGGVVRGGGDPVPAEQRGLGGVRGRLPGCGVPAGGQQGDQQDTGVARPQRQSGQVCFLIFILKYNLIFVLLNCYVVIF